MLHLDQEKAEFEEENKRKIKDSEYNAILKRMKKNKRQGGESILKFDVEMLPDDQNPVPEDERLRLSKLFSHLYYVSIEVNGNYVARTLAQALGKDLLVNIQETVSVYLVKWPESISLTVYQKAPFYYPWDFKVASVYMNLLCTEDYNATNVSADQNSQVLEFASEESHEPVWRQSEIARSAAKGTANVEHNLFHHTCGYLHVASQWASVEEGRQPEAPPLPLKNREFAQIRPTARDLRSIQKMKVTNSFVRSMVF